MKEALEKDQRLRAILGRITDRFPRSCDKRLVEGIEKLPLDAFHSFILQRSLTHLVRLFVLQFFLQKKAENAVEGERLFTRFFLYKTLSLIAFLPFSSKERIVDKECILKILQRIIPGVREIEGSFWQWLHPHLPYFCLYIELQKLRGKEFDFRELHLLKRFFKEQLTLQMQNPSLFWPFNEEEAYKQLRVLQNEIRSPYDLPQVTIHFKQQLQDTLEWLIHVAKPLGFPLDQNMGKLPFSVRVFLHFFHTVATIEMGCFSLFLPLQHFQDQHTINLLQVRDRIVQYLKSMLGEFRDYNGGLFEAQKDTFSEIFCSLATHIPHFTLFADRAFHALQPVEARISLPIQEIKELFQAISALMDQTPLHAYSSTEGVWVLRTQEPATLHPFVQKAKQAHLIYTEFDCGHFRYFSVIDKQRAYFPPSSIEPIPIVFPRVLKLGFSQGFVPSFSPYLAGGDLRCHSLSKLLYEGLMRLDRSGLLQLAAAQEFSLSPCGKKYIFVLRPFQWSNGRFVTAFDYVEAWTKILKREWHCNRPYLLWSIKNAENTYKGIDVRQELGIKALNSKVLEIELEREDPYFLEKLTQPIFFPTYGNVQEPSIFNGPYFVHSQNSDKLELEKNPYYWDVHNLFFSRICIDWKSNTEEMLHQFQERNTNWLGDPFNSLSFSDIRNIERENILYQWPIVRLFLIYFNTKHSLLRSILIRQALSLSLDRHFICTHIFPYYSPIDKVPMLSSTHLDSPIDHQELFERGLKNLNLCKWNLPTLVLHCVQLPGYEELTDYMQQTWKAQFNLNIQIYKSPWNEFRSLLERKDFQMGGCFANALSHDPLEFLQRFEEGSLFNFPQWEDAQYKKIMRDLSLSQESERKILMEQAAALLNYHTPYIPICMQTLLYTKHPKLRGEVFDVGGGVDFRFAFLEE